MLAWIGLFALASLLGADWPHAVRTTRMGGGQLDWYTVAIGVAVLSIFMLKARVALMNVEHHTRYLAYSFAYLNLSIVLFLGVITFVGLWPEFRVRNLQNLRIFYDALLVNVAFAAGFFLYHFTGTVAKAQTARLRKEEQASVLAEGYETEASIRDGLVDSR
jgi:hypothetical protein